MTVAAGFKCSDGYVLCADTEITHHDYYKENRAKIRAKKLPQCDLYWAICGDIRFVNMLMEKISDAVEACSKDMQEVRSEIERVCIDVSNAYPNYAQPEIPLLIHEKNTPDMKFVALSGPVVSPVSDWICVGTGQPLATHLIGDIYQRSMTMRAVGTLAAYALTHVKHHAFGCGGRSQIVMIGNDGSITPFMTKGPGEHNQEQEDFEKYILSLNRALKAFTFSVIGEQPSRQEFEQQLQSLTSSLRRISEERFSDQDCDEIPDEWWDGIRPPTEEELRSAMTPEDIKSLPTIPAILETDSSGRSRPVVESGWKLTLDKHGPGTALRYLRAWTPHQEEVRLLLDPSEPGKYWIAYKPKGIR